MISLQEARQILEPEFEQIPDEQLQELLEQMEHLARMMSDLFFVWQLK